MIATMSPMITSARMPAKMIVGFLFKRLRNSLTDELTRAARESYNMKQQRHRGVE